MPTIDPSIETIKNFPTPLTEGERTILNYFYKNLPEGWEIYVQPPVNGLKPDIVLLNSKVGVVVVEVKDWGEQQKFWHDQNGSRLKKYSGSNSHFVSPHPIDQVNNYRSEIIDLLSPSMNTKTHFRLITCLLFFSDWAEEKIAEVFSETLRLNKKFPAKPYSTNLIRGKSDLKKLTLNEFIPSTGKTDPLMSEEIAKEIRHWVSSSEFDTEQTRFVRLNNIQSQVVHGRTKSGYRRIKGSAGSGKSVVLAAKAAELARQNKDVLVLSFNITLKNYLRDLAVRYDRTASRNIVFLHYHGFASRLQKQFDYKKSSYQNSQHLRTSDDRTYLNDIVPEIIEEIVSKLKQENSQAFQALTKDAILVDEGQDFNIKWWNSLRPLLKEGGEMILAADPTQDLYDSASKWTDDAMKGAGFSGNWLMLEDNYRLPKVLAEKTNEFARIFLPEKAEKILSERQNELFDTEPAILRWMNIREENAAQRIANLIIEKVLLQDITKVGLKPLSMSDIVFLTPSNEIGREVVQHLHENKIRVHHTFDEDDDLQKKKKLFFFKGSECVKGSTIHSFKGLESRAIILYLREDKSAKDLHAAYAALTRLKAMSEGCVLYVLSSNSKFNAYGKTWQGQALYRQFHKFEEVAEDHSGISYKELFGDCLEGAKKVELRDPFIKTLHQFLNLEEFAQSIREVQSDNDDIDLVLITSEFKADDKASPDQQTDAMAKIKVQLKQKYNVNFTVLREQFHDRSIKTDHGWTISLGRGLDIFKPGPDRSKRPDQTERRCRAFNINYRRTDF